MASNILYTWRLVCVDLDVCHVDGGYCGGLLSVSIDKLSCISQNSFLSAFLGRVCVKRNSWAQFGG